MAYIERLSKPPFYSGVSEIGEGASKKQAKENAAKKVFKKLGLHSPGLSALNSINGSIVSSPFDLSVSNKDCFDSSMPNEMSMSKLSLTETNKNPISGLNEYCQKHGLPLPIWNITALPGLTPVFYATVTFRFHLTDSDVHVQGENCKSKKDAKNNCAFAALEKINILLRK